MSDRKLRELERLALSDPKAALDLAAARARSGRGNRIDAAHVTWGGGDPEQGFEELRQLWVERPAPELAEALSTLSLHVATPRGAVSGRTRALLVRSWHALDADGDCFDVPRLLDVLPLLRGQGALGLLESIEDWPVDPRVSQALLGLVRQPPQGWEGQKHGSLWRACLEQIERIGDPRAREVLEELRDPNYSPDQHYYMEQFEPVVQGRIPALLELCPAAPELSRDERTSLQTLLGSLGGGKDALWDAVYDDPKSLEARWALSAALEAEGDPRGEFIRLQLERGLGGKVTAREARLARDHARTWGGSLAGLGELRFEGGFPSALRIWDWRDKTPPEPRELLLLRRVRLDHAGLDDFLGLFPSLPAEVFGLPLKRFKDAPCEVIGLDRLERPGLVRICREAPPNLRALELYRPNLEPSDLEQLWSSGFGPQLEHLSIDPARRELSPWLPLAPGLAQLERLQTFRLASRLYWERETTELVLWRGPKRAFSRLLLRHPGSLFAARTTLESLTLPPCVTSVRLEVANKHLQRAKPKELAVLERLLGQLSDDFEIVPI